MPPPSSASLSNRICLAETKSWSRLGHASLPGEEAGWVVLPETRVLRSLSRRLLPLSGAPFYPGYWNDSLRRVVFFRGHENLMAPRSAPPDLMIMTGVYLGSDIPQSLQIQKGPDQNHLLTPQSVQPALPSPVPATGKTVHPTAVSFLFGLQCGQMAKPI